MRTDTQRLDWLLGIVESQDDEAAERLTAAYTLELRGRPMLDAAMGAKVIGPGEPMPALTAIDLATAEVGRIRNVKGFSEERDDSDLGTHDLAYAAVTYLTPDESRHEGTRSCPDTWPWNPPESFKPSPDDRKKELTKGIALALCELDRLIRAERRESLELQADVCREMNEAACEPEGEEHGFESGEDVTYPNYDTGLPERGEYRGRDFGGHARVVVAGGATLLFPYAELEHADG